MSSSCTLLERHLSVGADQVQVWHASLDLSAAEAASIEHTLAPDERARAARFRHAIDRGRFVACRGTLRQILSHYVGEAPEEIEFAYGERGKPRLRQAQGTHPLRFSVSHSQHLAAFAIAHEREVGVDIECLQTGFAWQEIADRFFAPDELKYLLALPPEDRYAAFLTAWTCKEACAKTRGDGLSLPLQSLPFHPSHNLYDSRWTLKTLPLSPGYAAAVAAEGADWRISSEPWLR